MSTKLVLNRSKEPFFNLACEEYFIDEFEDDFIILWQNANTIVIGRNQNTLEEINTEYVNNNGIRVVRRLSGGGAVYHDIGNINYTLIQAYKKDLFNNYSYFTRALCSYLQSLGLKPELSGRNDLLLDGKKFSGNAQTSRHGRIMHHGTILFSSKLDTLSACLKPNKQKLQSKGIKSVQSRVTNIGEYLPGMSIEDFFNGLYAFYLEHNSNIEEYEISPKDKEAIQRLVKDKYCTWEWNYGKSPKSTLCNSIKFEYGLVNIELNIEHLLITNMRISGDFFGILEIEALEKLFIGKKYEKNAINELLLHINISDYIHGMSNDDFVKLINA